MAEFQEVVRQAKRMCASYANDCTDCGLCKEDYVCPFDNLPEGMDLKSLPEVERIVMDWAEKNPEPRYPSWAEAWMQLFPAADLIPCPRKHFGIDCACIGEDSCQTCVNRQMYPFIAEKLGINPIGGNENA